jgi:C4-dicarboxylate-specific signal transduction histidine kinase
MRRRAKDWKGDRFSQAVLDALPSQVVLLDSRGHIIAANGAWRRFALDHGALAGPEAGLGLGYLSVVRRSMGEDAQRMRTLVDGVTAVVERSAETFSTEYPCRTPERELWFLVSVTALGGGLEGALIVHLDISARKLAEDRVRQVRERAAQASRVRALGVLAASLVHELAQPLGAAGLYSGTAVALLSRGPTAPDPLAAALEGVDSQIQRANQIVQRLRGFLRRRETRPEPVSIGEVVAGVVELVRWFATEHGVDLRFEGLEPSPVVVADAVGLEQVLVDLICASIQAMDAGGVPRGEVRIGMARRPGEVEVTIRSAASGRSREGHEPPRVVLASGQGPGPGNEAGLSVSREIVEANGGRLWSDATTTEGASFHFTVPLRAEGSDRDV